MGLKCLRKTYVWQKNSGTCNFSEVSERSVDGTSQNISSKKVKEKLLYFALLPTKKAAQCLMDFWGCGDNICHI